MKEPISFGVSFEVVRLWEVVLSILLEAEEPSLWGYLITAAIIAGRSKALIKLFHDLLKIRSTAEEERLVRRAETAVRP